MSADNNRVFSVSSSAIEFILVCGGAPCSPYFGIDTASSPPNVRMGIDSLYPLSLSLDYYYFPFHFFFCFPSFHDPFELFKASWNCILRLPLEKPIWLLLSKWNIYIIIYAHVYRKLVARDSNSTNVLPSILKREKHVIQM